MRRLVSFCSTRYFISVLAALSALIKYRTAVAQSLCVCVCCSATRRLTTLTSF